jgi:hypothetical protein
MRSFITCMLHEMLYGCQIKEDGIGGACSTDGEMRNAYSLLVVKPEGMRPLGRPRNR